MNIINNILRKIKELPHSALSAIEEIGGFVIAAFEYFIYRIDTTLNAIKQLTVTNLNLYRILKFKIVGTLIWSQGKVGLRIRNLFILIFICFVFILGGIFQDRFVEIDGTDELSFLNTDSLLIAKASASTQQSDTKLLDSPVEHTVVENESLSEIGMKYGITIESIKFANNLVKSEVPAGTVLKIPPVEGTLHQVKADTSGNPETIESLARRYRVPTQTIVDFNYLDLPYTLTVGQFITIPKAEVPSNQRYYAGTPVYDTSAYGIIPTSKTGGSGGGKFNWPLSGILTQGFSSYHPAIDIANRTGDILAGDKGTVVRSGWWQGGYGNAVQLDHGNGYVSTYAHMSSISVSVGDEVSQGQKLGVVGSTGRSTGPHLHFTIQFDGKYISPMDLLPR
ncbi:MAG: hypothetical protein QG570_8 [Patescibacteria group bacterium]|nr:hypothetical protein [Patescibacteria group bacterium]